MFSQTAVDNLLVKKRTFEIRNDKFLNKKVTREGYTIYDKSGNIIQDWERAVSFKTYLPESHSSYEYDSLNRKTVHLVCSGDLNSQDTVHCHTYSYPDDPDGICTKDYRFDFLNCKTISEEKLTYTAYISKYGEAPLLQPQEYIDSVLLKKTYKNDEFKGRDIYFFKYDSLGRVSYEYQNLSIGENSTHITYTYAKNTIIEAHYTASASELEKDDVVTYVTTFFNADNFLTRKESYTYSKSRDRYYDIWSIRDFDNEGNTIQLQFGGEHNQDRKRKFSNRKILNTNDYTYDSNGQVIQERYITKTKGSKITSKIITYTYEYW